MLPVSLLPNINILREQANQFMTTLVQVYQTTISYDDYGQEIVSSGLRFSVSGYVGKISGRDRELLAALQLEGSENDMNILVLTPFDYPIENTDTIVAMNTDYRVVWTNDHTQDSVQVYQKAICARKEITPEQRYNRG